MVRGERPIIARQGRFRTPLRRLPGVPSLVGETEKGDGLPPGPKNLEWGQRSVGFTNRMKNPVQDRIDPSIIFVPSGLVDRGAGIY